RPRSPGRAGVSQRLPVLGPRALPDGGRHLGVHGPPRGALPDRGPPVRGHQGLLVALVLARGEAAALAGAAGPGHPLPLAGDAGVVHPVCRRAPRARGTWMVDYGRPAPPATAVLC